MRLNECIFKIENYLSSDDMNPRFVNVESIADLQEVKARFHAGNTKFLDIKNYGKDDVNPHIEELLNDLDNIIGTVFVVGLTSYLRLKGKGEMMNRLSALAANSYNAHVIILCYQCDEFLDFSDSRLKRLVYTVDGERTKLPKLIFTTEAIPINPEAVVVNGINFISDAIEKEQADVIYVRTKREKRAYPHSLLTIISEKNAYDALCKLDPVTEMLKYEYGTEEQWSVALKEVSRYKSWAEYICSEFHCTYNNLHYQAQVWEDYGYPKKWLYFIGIKLFGAKGNWCVDHAAKKMERPEDFPKYIYNSLMDVDWESDDFKEKYNQRKNLLKKLEVSDDIVLNYCNSILINGSYALYYLTDNTRIEKVAIIKLLSEHGTEFERDELLDILKYVYPDLYMYLKPYNFKNDMLSTYFNEYKYQKVINTVFPSFEKLVEEQAEKREYNLLLPSRTEKLDEIEKKNSVLYFIDALGVEFLSFIVEKSREYKLMVDITVCKAELPTITERNKEFVDIFKDAGAQIVSIKDLDEIKHKGEGDYNYDNTKEPIHLIKELEIVDSALKTIQARLINGVNDSAVIIADHGASRLAVVSNKDLSIDVNSKGFKNGRICSYTDDISKVKYAAVAGDNNEYYVLANYERFKGGRKASVEAHGGATLEEVAVPIIVITYANEIIKVENQTPKIRIGRKMSPKIEFFVSKQLRKVSIIVKGKNFEKQYEAKPLKDNKFMVCVDDIRRKGTYTFDVYAGDNRISEGIKFEAVSAGMSENNIL